eukprot:11421132-Heterocapsa_arctica.AAC.1
MEVVQYFAEKQVAELERIKADGRQNPAKDSDQLAARHRAKVAAEEVVGAAEAKHLRASRNLAEAKKDCKTAEDAVQTLIQKLESWRQTRIDERNF